MRNGTITNIALVQIITDYSGIIIHRRDGLLHRDDGPAIISPGGDRWYFNKGVFLRLVFIERGGIDSSIPQEPAVNNI